MNTLLRWRNFWFALWVFGMLMGIYLSLSPADDLMPDFELSDKIIHGTSYCMLAIFAWCIFEQKNTKVVALLWLVLFSGFIELAQGYLTTTRSMEFYDFIANCIGIVFGALLARRWNVLLLVERKLQFSRLAQ